MMNTLRVMYAGTPDFAVPALQALLDSEYEVVAVYTQPDRPAGRGRQLRPSAVKCCALQQRLPVEQPLSFNDVHSIKRLQSYQADIMVVAAYGLLLPAAVLQAPRYGCINIHASLLPRWRGAAPIQQAILAGDVETGITLMQMNQGLDTGDILLKSVTPIMLDDTSQSLHDRLAQMGADVLLQGLQDLQAGTLQAEAQDERLSCYAGKINKQDAYINWCLPAEKIMRQVRAYYGWPVAYTHWHDKVLRVWRALVLSDSACSDYPPGAVINCDRQGLDVQTGLGILRITDLQLAGSKMMSAAAFMNAHDLTGQQFV